jgi:DNA-binding NtrC family response regulator
MDRSSRYSSLSGRRVLIVEDDRLIAWDLAEGLREHGADVMDPRHSAAAALRCLDCEPAPDVALLDIGLDDEIFPAAVAERLNAQNIPFIFYSGYRPRDVDRRFENAIFCEKPVEMRVLATALERAIARKRTYSGAC